MPVLWVGEIMQRMQLLNPGFPHDKGGGFRVKVGQQALQTLSTKA